jgi:hypothetical protein
MREDPVRMIRAVRLAAKLNFEIEATTARAIEVCASDLVKASTPRLVEETYRTLMLSNSARALLLMERLGLLDFALPTLSRHLKQHHHELEEAPTLRIMQALGDAIGSGFEPARGFLLACLFADMHVSSSAASDPSNPLSLSNELRARGFSRGDTEHLRLLLEALGRMVRPSRATRRLVGRLYFPHARRLFELIAPIYAADPAELDRYLSAPPSHHRGPRSQRSVLAAGDTARPHRRRGRRGGRAGRGRRHRLQVSGDSASPKAQSNTEAGAFENSLEAQVAVKDTPDA